MGVVLLAVVALVVVSLLGRGGTGVPPAPSPELSPEQLRQRIEAAAVAAGVDPRLLHATAIVESSMRVLAPRPDAGTLTYYPLGMKVIAAQTADGDLSDDDADFALRDLDQHLELGARYARWLWRAIRRRDDPQEHLDAFRAGWAVRPREGRDGPPFPVWTQLSRENWDAALRKVGLRGTPVA